MYSKVHATSSDSVVINEFGQGTSGNSFEWVELLVTGSGTGSTIDLRGWKLGDKVTTSNKLTFSTDAIWNNISAGTLIVVYNNVAGKTSNFPADDVSMSDSNNKIVVPHNNTTLFSTGSAWNSLSNSGGDTIVLRDTFDTIGDSLSYGSDTTYSPQLTLVGSQKAAHFTGSNVSDQNVVAKWAIINDGATPVTTPGAGNTADNIQWIQTLRSVTAPANVANVTATPAPNAWPLNTQITLNSSTIGSSVYAEVYAPGGTATDVFHLITPQVELNGPKTIRTYASAPGYSDSSVSTFEYTILNKTNIATARMAPKSKNVWTEGTVTHINGQEMYIQDDSAGILLYGFPAFANVGDVVEVAGVMDIYFDLQEIKPVTGLSYQVVQANAGVPDAELIDSRGFVEANEGKLVRVSNVTIGTGNEFNEYTITDAYGSFMIKSSWLETGKKYDQIIGVLTYTFGAYKLLPRTFSDIVERNFSVTPGVQPGIVSASTQVSLSTPLIGASVHYTVDGSTPTASSTPFTAPITISAPTTTIKAVAVIGVETSEVYTFEYITQQTYADKKIHDIQGASHVSPIKGHKVTGVKGVVTHTEEVKGTKRFYIQELSANMDSDPNTSEATVVISTYGVVKGDYVTVNATVSEIKEDGYADAKDLTTTALTGASVTKIGTFPVPAPIVIGVDRIQPRTIIDNDGMQIFDPAEDALDFYESMESMVVQLNTPKVVGPYHFEIPVIIGDQTDEVITPNGGLMLTENDLNPQRILIKKELTVKTGDVFNGSVIGILGYDFSNYKVLPTQSMPAITPSVTAQEVTSIVYADNKLTIAGFNIENFWNNPSTDGIAKKSKIAQAVVNKLNNPDIIGLIEVQDNNGESDNGVVDASQNYTALINAIQTAGGPVYNFTEIAPNNNVDGGAPGGNIRVGYLYNPARVSLVAKAAGDANTAVSYGSNGLSHNPGRIDPTNEAFSNSRKPLAAEFEFQGERVLVINNHFNSKSGDPAPYGAAQPLPNPLGSEIKRHEIAAIVNGFVKGILQQNSNANLVVLGDFNDFQFSRTLQILKGNELTNKVDDLPPSERYSYVYQGNSQTLDHMLVDKKLAPHATLDMIHMNADFDKSHGRVSDHDPYLVQLDLAAKKALLPNNSDPTTSTPETGPSNMNPNSITVPSGSVAVQETKGTTADGRPLSTVTISKDKLLEALKTLPKEAKELLLESKSTDAVVKFELPAEILIELMAKAPDVGITVKSAAGTYSLPANGLDIADLAKVLGSDTKDIKITITIDMVAGEKSEDVESKVKALGSKIIGAPVDFTISAEASGNSVEVDQFDMYVSRTLPLPSAVDANKVTVVKLDADGKPVFVPAKFGNGEVELWSRTNSVYTIIESNISFADVASHWAKKDVELLANKMVVDGVSNTSFSPEANVTRAQFATMLTRALGLAEDKSSSRFIDVKTSEWYAGSVGVAASQALIEGFENGTFMPNEEITREQMAVMATRAMKFAGKTPEASTSTDSLLTKFQDQNKISTWARNEIMASMKASIMDGMSDTVFAPDQQATRAQAAVMLKRLLQYVNFIN
jgi:predicted extracellular nuclease